MNLNQKLEDYLKAKTNTEDFLNHLNREYEKANIRIIDLNARIELLKELIDESNNLNDENIALKEE